MVQLTAILASSSAAATVALTILATTASTMTAVDAHPGQPAHQRSLLETTNSRLFKHNAQRSLKACSNAKAVRELQQRAAERRHRKLRELRESNVNRQSNANRNRNRNRGLAAADVLATSHKSNLTGLSSFDDADIATLFGTTPKCVLEPEVTQGPYYVSGELIRNDIRETQAGVDLYAEFQFIDVNTCEPLAGLYLDFWHCNATGVYAGVVANGNGDASDQSNLDATFLRGLAPTDDDGIVQFTTKFPGHYTSRSTHIHLLGSQHGAVLANNTYAGGQVASVGQVFFDQDLISAVEATGAYATNTQELTTNADDGIFAEETVTGFDPVMEYVYVGDAVEDGIFAWISIGVDATVAKSVTAAATLTAEGGVAGTSTGGNGGGSPPSGSMGGPGGSFGGPSGSMGAAPADAAGSSASVSAGSSVGNDAAATTTTTTTSPTVTTTTTPAPSSACE